MTTKGIFKFSLLLILASCMESSSDNYVIVDGIKLPIDGCIEAQKRTTIGNFDARSFCKCMIPKMYHEYKDDPTKLDLLKMGKLTSSRMKT